MANNRFNKQVSPKGYADGGTVEFKGIAKDLKELRKKGIKTTTPALLEKLNRKNRKGKK